MAAAREFLPIESPTEFLDELVMNGASERQRSICDTREEVAWSFDSSTRIGHTIDCLLEHGIVCVRLFEGDGPTP